MAVPLLNRPSLCSWKSVSIRDLDVFVGLVVRRITQNRPTRTPTVLECLWRLPVRNPDAIVYKLCNFACYITFFLELIYSVGNLILEISNGNKQCSVLLALAGSQRFIILLRNLLEKSLKGSLPLAKLTLNGKLPIPTVKHAHSKHGTWNGQATMYFILRTTY